jgi:hypothetical protein
MLIPSARWKPCAGSVSPKTAATAWIESLLATVLSRLGPNTATRCRRSITSPWLSATSTTLATSPTSVSPWQLAVLLDRLGRLEPAATIAGFAFSPLAAAAVPQSTTAIAHLRDALGDQTYESLARRGEQMTTAAMVTYAFDRIDQARAELEHPS